jgi:hypothetical protein
MSEFAKFEIELPTSFSVQRGGGHVTIQTADIAKNGNIMAILIENELTNKVGDAAAGVKAALGAPFHDGESVTLKDDDMTDEQRATMAAKATAMMQRVIDNIIAGKWTVRRVGGASDPYAPFRKHLNNMLNDIIRQKDSKAKTNAETREKLWSQLPEHVQANIAATAKARMEKEQREADSILDGIDIKL